MKAELYLPEREKPVAVLDEVTIFEFNDNHTTAPVRVFYKSHEMSSGRTMIELFRDEPMRLSLEDGRSGRVLLQHTSMDMLGNAIGVLRVLGTLQKQAEETTATASAG